jgi:flagellar biosynthetic protein FliQ
MSENMLVGIIKDAVTTGLTLAAPILIASLVVGLIISIFQATTQIQEQTLTFVPKLIIVAVVGIVLGNWMLHTMMEFTVRIFELIANVVK